ncbi:hypothetical protein BJ965_001045 [Streptomyces luteogriseus]|uniref:Uncharacterized protein n=1 Tax=Streptomyces luteogriseus TaxID=68233 RepID=A0A7W7DIQ5_9ACTN|nr:hypothetical protein [Streptomyces luteogriseus]MBB4711163.1 hypothetical protein [Streptomyces luteogriseus]
MVMVTADELEQAETDAEEAQQSLRDAERRYSRSPGSADAYERHQEAIGRAEHAKVRAKVLREEWEQQKVVREARAAAGEAAAREMAGTVAELGSSRLAAVRAVVEAERAMGRALAALDAHDRAVRAAGAELERRGLRHQDDEETGANLDGSAWIAGVKWPLVDAGGVLGRCLSERVTEVWPRHPLARAVWPPYGGLSAVEGRDVLLGLVRAERRR